MNAARALLTNPLPISREEFAQFFRKCGPPTGWPQKMAVGYSGGADSTALLFLLNRYLRDKLAERPDFMPSELFSLTVDHGLQEGSDAVAAQCAARAKAMGVPHVTSTIPWSESPYPDKPAPGESMEETGRNVRYQALFDAMKAARIDVLALGHHVDDQVETSLMRMARGTTELGAGGMRKCRRWGMGTNGTEKDLGWAGLEGMNRWIVRPLLEVSKDRLLATCEENKLEYTTDKTNFQPQLTLRNAIRYMLSKNTLDPTEIDVDLPDHITKNLQKVQSAIAGLESVDMDITGGPRHLRAAVNVLSDQAEDVDSLAVDTALNRSHLPSPTGSYLVSYRGLATTNDPLVRRALVLRILRYVSFHAWGTVRADGNRRRESLTRIVDCLWTPDPFKARLMPFVAGGGVMWTPVLVGREIHFPMNGVTLSPRTGEIVAWLASRQPPLSLARMATLGITNPLRINLTERLRAALQRRDAAPGEVIDVLWDCRFMLRLDVGKVPDDLARVILDGKEELWIHPHTRWYWPKVLRMIPNAIPELRTETVIHSTLAPPEQSIAKLDRDTMALWPRVRILPVTASWIHVEWIRSLSAI
ncbi:PP-loop family-domain-containing protein [Mycena latifolia]|nr:PP-loop family-domain-containing protein [Mycena latifolia]